MKRFLKRTLAILMTVVMLIGIAPLNGFVGLELPDWLNFSTKASALAETGQCGDDVYWTFDESTGLLTIRGDGEMEEYGYYSFQCNNAINTVVIEYGVSNISDDLFVRCTGLTSVSIPDSVTSIGYAAFEGCTGLKSITIPDSVTFIGTRAFSGCSGLTKITVDSNNTIFDSRNNSNAIIETDTNKIIHGCKNTIIPSSVTSIGDYAFESCYGLTSITIPDSIVSIGEEAFFNCTGLTSVTIPDSVTSIGFDAFYNVANIVYNGTTSETFWGQRALNGYIEYPLVYSDSEKTDLRACVSSYSGDIAIPESVRKIQWDSFYRCTNLTNIIVNENNGNFVSDSYGVLYNIDKTELIKYPCGNARNSYNIPDSVTSIETDAFEGCTALTNITIPNSVTSIDIEAFNGCTGLKSITIPDSVTYIGWEAFCDCRGLNSVNIGNKVEYIDSCTFYGCTSLKSVTIPNSVTDINDKAFYNCRGLTSVAIGSGVTSIGNDAFGDCNNLTRVNINSVEAWCNIHFASNSFSNPLFFAHKLYLNGEIITDLSIPDNVTSISSNAFSNCTELTSVKIGSSVTDICWGAFSDCTGLTNITFPDSLLNIGPFAFDGCIRLKNITIPDSVTSIGSHAFNGCASLKSITIPGSVATIESGTFEECTGLTSVIIGKGVKHIDQWAFSFCTNLTNITIPDSVTSIGSYAFWWCTSLDNIDIPDSVTQIGNCAFYFTGYSNNYNNWQDGILFIGNHLIIENNPISETYIIKNGTKTIAYGVFSYSSDLKSIYIPSSITGIGEEAFFHCSNLTDVYYAGTEEQWNNISFGQDNEDLLNATIHFNSGSEPFDPDENLYHLYAFSNEPNLMMSDKGSMRLTFQTDCYDYEHDAYLLSGVEYTVTSSDNHVASIKSINAQDDKTTVLIYGDNPGTAMLTVTANYDGHAVAGGQFPITVMGEGVYHADNIPKFNDYNIICNGILIDNYKYTKTDGETCEISFDAYNTHNCFGAVEVHDKNGELLYSQSLANCPTGIPSSLWDTVAELFNVTDYNNRSYKDEDCSKKTSVDISGIPRDGYITISNDVMSSQVCAIYNLAYLTAEVSFKCLKLVTSSDTEDDAKAEIAENLGKEIIELILDSPKDTADKTFKSVVKKFISAANLGSKSGMNEAVKSFALIIKDLDIDLTGIVWDALKASAISVAKGTVEKALYTALGIPGTLMEAGYDLIGIGETASIIQSVSDNVNSGKTSIYCSNSASEVKYSNGYLVRSQELFDMNNVTFHQYKIVNGKSYDDAAAAFKDEKIVNVISMALYQNGVEVQPKGSVEVAIPVPKGMNELHAKIFRQESDGSYTQLKYRLDDGYMYITTEHFSVYCIVGDYDYGDYLEFEDAEITLKPEDVFCQYPLTHSGNDAEYADYVWTSSNTNVVQVDDSGIIAAIGDGAATITVTERNRNLTASYKVNVKSDKILKLNLDKEETINYKKSFNIKDKYSVECSENYTVKYESSNPKVATVDQNGNVYGAKKGSADIKVTVTDSAGNTVTDTCNVKVKYSFGQWLIVILLFGWIWY